MVAAELLLALHLSANAIESTNDGGAPAASIGTAIEACSSIIQTEKDRHRLGHVDKLNPDSDAGKQHEGGEALDQLVVAGGDTA